MEEIQLRPSVKLMPTALVALLACRGYVSL